MGWKVSPGGQRAQGWGSSHRTCLLSEWWMGGWVGGWVRRIYWEPGWFPWPFDGPRCLPVARLLSPASPRALSGESEARAKPGADGQRLWRDGRASQPIPCSDRAHKGHKKDPSLNQRKAREGALGGSPLPNPAHACVSTLVKCDCRWSRGVG